MALGDIFGTVSSSVLGQVRLFLPNDINRLLYKVTTITEEADMSPSLETSWLNLATDASP